MVFVLALLLLATAGCARRESAFRDWTQYLESTPIDAIDTEDAARHINRLVRKEDCVSFLWEKARGHDPEDAVAACSVLVEIVHVPTWRHSDYFAARAAEVGPTNLLNHMKAMDTAALSPKWLERHRINLKSIKTSDSGLNPEREDLP